MHFIEQCFAGKCKNYILKNALRAKKEIPYNKYNAYNQVALLSLQCNMCGSTAQQSKKMQFNELSQRYLLIKAGPSDCGPAHVRRKGGQVDFVFVFVQVFVFVFAELKSLAQPSDCDPAHVRRKGG